MASKTKAPFTAKVNFTMPMELHKKRDKLAAGSGITATAYARDGLGIITNRSGMVLIKR